MLQKLRQGLRSMIETLFKPLLNAEPHERSKLMFLSICLSCIVATYSIIKPLKDSVFFVIVGKDYQPYAKWLTIIFMPICMLFYSKIVDRLRRYQLVYFFTTLYALFCLIFCYFLSHPAYGLHNTESSKYRILGWVIYLVLDVYPILVLSTFWAFSNSISSPESAKHNYGLMVAASKVSGIISPLIILLLVNHTSLSRVTSVSSAIGIAAIMLLIAGLSIIGLVKKIPGRYLHGYEAAYELEKKKSLMHKDKTGIWQGFKFMLTEPYVFGIFGMVYSYEIISQILDYQKNVMASIRYNNEIGGMFSFALFYTAAFQCLGIFFAIFGTGSLLQYSDVGKCLMVVPLITTGLLISLIFFPNLLTIFIVMVFLRAMNYGFNVPIREMLYIPTVKDIKFKAKAWTDSFGRTLSKGSGATINMISRGATAHASILRGSVFSLGVVGIWAFISYFVAKRYNKTIKEDKVIGGNS